MCNTCGCKKAEDISKDIFGNKSDAKDRAKELGSKHTHSHKINGDVIHMPFKTHKEYQKNMGAESFENETFCADCGSRRRHDAESFDAEVYAIEDGGKTELSFQELFDYLNDAIDNEYFLTKGERDDYYEKYYREYEAESFEAQSSTKEMNEAYKQYKINLEKYVGFGDLWEKIHDESLRLQSQGLIAFDAWNKACKKFKVYDKLTKGVNMEHLREREKRYEPDSYYGGAESFEAPKKKIFRGKRPSPSTSATSVNIGTKMRGGNGKMWVCKSYPRGKTRVKRWVLAAEDFDADFDKAPYDSWDDAWSDDIEFPPMDSKQRIGEENLFIKNLTVVGALAGAILLGKTFMKN